MASEDVWFNPALPAVVGTWFGVGLPDLLVKGDPTVAIRIAGDTMTLVGLALFAFTQNHPLTLTFRYS
jgi:hypothetical protein